LALSEVIGQGIKELLLLVGDDGEHAAAIILIQ
jgi:hypothetical protein